MDVPQGCVYELREEEKYEPMTDTMGYRDVNVFGGSPPREYRVRPALELALLKRLRHGPNADYTPRSKRRRDGGRAGGMSPMLGDKAWWHQTNPCIQWEGPITEAKKPTCHTCDHQ